MAETASLDINCCLDKDNTVLQYVTTLNMTTFFNLFFKLIIYKLRIFSALILVLFSFLQLFDNILIILTKINIF